MAKIVSSNAAATSSVEKVDTMQSGIPQIPVDQPHDKHQFDEHQMQEIIEKLEKFRLDSSKLSGSSVSDPYKPSVWLPSLATNINQVCSQPVAQDRVIPQESYPQDQESKLQKVMVPKIPKCDLPKFNGHDFEIFVEKFGRFLRLSGLQNMSDEVKCDWLAQAADPSTYVNITGTIKRYKSDIKQVLTSLARTFPTLDNDMTLSKKLSEIPCLSYQPEPR